jgi:two-component system, NarL family, nitrate/nitrite response regulator NarL
MRVVLVGKAADRDRLRADLAETGLELIGEAATIAEAQAGGWIADAFLVARREPSSAEDDQQGAIEEPLTRRELDVLGLLAEGLSNKAIAERLGISDQTVKFHVAAVIAKLGATNRTDAVRRGIRRGVVVI